MKTAKLTVILLAAAVMLLVAVPTLREVFADVYRTYGLPGAQVLPTKAQYTKVAMEHREDLGIWLGFAAAIDTPLAAISEAHVPHWGQSTTWTAGTAYEHAIVISPHSPAPYLRYALYLLANSGELGRKDIWSTEREDAPRRTPTQIANLRQAESLLKRARRLQPDNAACDYLLAYIYLAQHQDDQAHAALQAAVGKPHWNIADVEAATGLLRLMDGSGMPGILVATVAMGFHAVASPFRAPLKGLAGTLAHLGEQFRAQGRHQEAIVYYEATLHLGHILRTDAYSMIDGLVAIAITDITSGAFLSAEQERQVEEDTPITEDEAKLSWEARMAVMMGHAGHRDSNQVNELRQHSSVSEEEWEKAERWWHQTEERSNRMQQARVANFTAYLRQHGRTDLAAFYEADVKAANEWREEVKPTLNRSIRQTRAAFSRGPVRYSWVVWSQAAAFLALWVIVGLVSLGTRYWRQPHAYMRWSYWQWLLLLAIVIIGGQILATTSKFEMLEGAISVTDPVHFMAIRASASIGIGAWLLGALAMTLVKRARQTREERLGKARTYLASLRTLLPPTLAAFMVLSVIGLWPLHENSQYWEREQRTMIEQGEVQYWGLGSASEEHTSSLPCRLAQKPGQRTTVPRQLTGTCQPVRYLPYAHPPASCVRPLSRGRVRGH
ncbi:MAG: tetratricopeptide repeat protein [Armatimonadetes bacterium]|nr:tetratricopeptide repeat protein [Armatimonadota bacterium]